MQENSQEYEFGFYVTNSSEKHFVLYMIWSRDQDQVHILVNV